MNKDIKVNHTDGIIKVIGLNGEAAILDFHEAVKLCKDLKKEIREVAADQFLKISNVENL